MKVYVAAVAKLENNYIREWIQHHIDKGFDKVIVYDNNDKGVEDIASITQDYIKSGKLVVEDRQSQLFNQKEMYREIYEKYGKECDWILYVDIDEFIQFDKAKNIKEFLTNPKFEKVKYIRICWKTYTDSGLLKVENGNYSIKRFKIPLENTNSMMSRRCKSIYKTKDAGICKGLSVHTSHFNGEFPCCDVLGNECGHSSTTVPKAIWKVCWINHYSTKTIEEYITNKIKKHVLGNRQHDSKYDSVYIPGLVDLSSFWEVNKRTKEKEALAKELYEKYHITDKSRK